MATYKRDVLLNELQHHTEIVLRKAIEEWQLIPHSRFALKPSAEGWSANECLQHLNSYGRYYLPAIEKAINQLQNRSSSSEHFSPGWLGNYFTRLMLPAADGSLSKTMKSPGDHTPNLIPESHEVIAEFIDQQEKMIQLLRLAGKVDLNKRNVGISIAPFIKLKLGDVFMFVIAHIIRHVQQAERALTKAGVTGNAISSFSLTSMVS